MRQLQWWDEQAIFSPVRKGHSRVWSQSEMREVDLVMDLRSKGMALQKIRRVLVKYRAITVDLDASTFYLLSTPDGRSQIHIARDKFEVVDLMSKASKPMILSVVQNGSQAQT
jgi:DNA-binding transcriptional MerR regulator